MSSAVVDRTLFWIWWFGIIIVGTMLVKFSVFASANVEDKFEHVQDGVVANRVLKCFSSSDEFGVIERSKVSSEELENCFGKKYNFKIEFDTLSISKIDLVEVGDFEGEVRFLSRFVIVDGKAARMEVSYSKNAA